MGDVIPPGPQSTSQMREYMRGIGIKSADWLPELGVLTSSWAVALFFLFKDNLFEFLNIWLLLFFTTIGVEALREERFFFRSSEIQGWSSISSFWNESMIYKTFLSLVLYNFVTVVFLWSLKLLFILPWYKMDLNGEGSNLACQGSKPGSANCCLCDLMQVT